MLEVLDLLQRLRVPYFERFARLECSLLVSNASGEYDVGVVRVVDDGHSALLSLLLEFELYSLHDGSEFEAVYMNNSLVSISAENKSSILVLEPEGNESEEVVVEG